MVNRIFAIGKFDKDLFLSVAMLHAFSGDLANVCDHVATALASSTKEAQFTSSDIRKGLDAEQQILDSDRLMHATSDTLVVQPA
jgi:hypothetical protein